MIIKLLESHNWLNILDLRQAAKCATKAAKHGILSSLCSELNRIQKINNGVIKHGVIKKLSISTKQATPDMNITRHDIQNMTKKRKPESDLAIAEVFDDGIETSNTLMDYFSCDQLSKTSFRRTGGLPKGSTKIKAKTTKISFINGRNEIATIYVVEKKVAQFK